MYVIFYIHCYKLYKPAFCFPQGDQLAQLWHLLLASAGCRGTVHGQRRLLEGHLELVVVLADTVVQHVVDEVDEMQLGSEFCINYGHLYKIL